MLSNLFLIFFDLGLFILYGIIGFVGFCIIQLISYRIFKFNLYKWLNYQLFDKQVKNWKIGGAFLQSDKKELKECNK